MTSHGHAAPGRLSAAVYHHGDLRQALIETAIEMLGERGAEAFSMAEASRRLGVAASAPYRHVADRDALLAAVALRAAGLLAEQLDRHAASGTPAQRLAAAARAYVHFADDQRPLFQARPGPGSARTATPRSQPPRSAIGTAFLSPSAELRRQRNSGRAARVRHRGHGHTATPCSCSTAVSASGRHTAEAAASNATAATGPIGRRDCLTRSG